MGLGGVEHLEPGLALPSVTLIATDRTSFCAAERTGRSVIAVYPWTGRPGLPNPPGWDDIPGAHGSTPELEGFRDLFQSFKGHGTRVFGLSGQGTDYQREAVERLRLPFALLSDADGAFAAALQLPSFATGGHTYLTRLTLVVENGDIEQVFYPVLDPHSHASEVLRWLQKTAHSPIASSSASSTE